MTEIVKEIIEKPSECHFAKDGKDVCAPPEIVTKMAAFLKNKDEDPGSSPKQVVAGMKEMLDCKSESCVIKHPDFIEFAKISNINKILDENFKPSGPALTFDWLSNDHIDDALAQLEKVHKDFLHIPYQMRDFEKVGTELATIDLAEKFREGYNSFGVVLNTDTSKGNGIHWYCLFGIKDNGKIVQEYFNSSGQAPLAETQAWLQKTKHHLQKELGIPVDIKYSTGIVFQNDEHSCGVYSLMYLWLRLKKVPSNWFKADTFNDALAHKARKVLFRHEK